MKQKVMLLIKSFLMAVAMTMEFGTGIKPEYYENNIDYIIASIYDLLGEYDVKFLFVWLLAGVFLFFLETKIKKEGKKCAPVGLAFLFSLFLLWLELSPIWKNN